MVLNDSSKPKKVLYTSYLSEDNLWSSPICNVINNLENKDEALKLSPTGRRNLGDIMLAISYRLDALPVLRQRLSSEVAEVFQIVRSRDYSKDMYAFEGLSKQLIHSLLLDIDALVFELRSCCELMEKLIKIISRKYREHYPAFFTEELPREWLKADWYESLRNLRIDIFHHTAPYVDIDISNEQSYDLLFPKRNLHDYGSSEDFFRLSDLNKIIKGFDDGVVVLQYYFVNKISLCTQDAHHLSNG